MRLTKRIAAVFLCPFAAALSVGAQTDSLQCNFESLLSTTDVSFRTRDVAITGNYAFVGTLASPNDFGIEIYDISDPSQPIHSGSAIDDRIEYISIADTTAFAIAYSPTTIYALDISNPQSPSTIGSLSVPGGFDSAVHNGTTLYVSTFSSGSLERGVYVIDVSDPTAMIQTDRLAYNGLPGQMAFLNDTLFHYASTTGLSVFDCTNPTSPKLLTVYEEPSFGNLFVADDNLLYANCNGDQVCALDVSDPAAIQVLGEIDMPFILDYDRDGNTGYSGGYEGLFVFDIANPTNPIPLGSIDSPTEAESVTAHDGLVFLAGPGNGLDILDINHTRASPLLSQIPPRPGRISNISERAIARHGDTVYLWHTGSRSLGDELLRIDVSDPANPAVLGAVPLRATDIQFRDQHVHIVFPSHSDGYSIFNVQDPNTWNLVGSLNLPGWDLELRDQMAFMAGDHNSTLVVVDISDPANPSQIGSLKYTMRGYSIEIGGNAAFLIDFGEPTLLTVDVSDPSKPTATTTTQLPGAVIDIALVDNWLYAIGLGDIYTLDVSNPATPILTSTTPLIGNSVFVSIHHEDGILFAGGEQLVTLDISNPAQPVVNGWYDPSNVLDAGTNWMDIASSNGFAYINAGEGGLQIVDVSGPCDTPCLADTNHDGILSPTDFTAWVGAFNSQLPECDQNNDGSCTPTDFTAWIGNYNAGCP